MKKTLSLTHFFSRKTLSFILILSMVIGVFALILPVKAYSAETTGLETYSFQTNQQNYAKVGIYHIYAFDNKLVFYDDNAVLQNTYVIPALTYQSNASSTVIRKMNETTILLAHLTGTVPNDSSFHHYQSYAYGLLNVNTLVYESIATGSTTLGDSAWSSSNFLSNGVLGSSLSIIKYQNTTGYYFYALSSIQTAIYGSIGFAGTAIANRTEFIYLGKTNNAGTWTSQYSVIQSEDNAVFHGFNLVIDSDYGMPTDTAFIITPNNFQDSGRATVFRLNLTSGLQSYNYIGITPLDGSYTSFLNSNSAHSSGMIYLFGVGTYGNKIYVNSAFSSYTATGITFSTIVFNSSNVDSIEVDTGLLSDSLLVRPFTGSIPMGELFGNVSGTYSIGYFSSIFNTIPPSSGWYDSGGRLIVDSNGYYWATETGYISYNLLFRYWHNATGTYVLHSAVYNGGMPIASYTLGYKLTGLSFNLAGIETGLPTWTVNQVGFLFTPQQPQSNPYDTWEIGGFQQLGAPIGCFVDMVRYNKCEAGIMYNLAPPFTFNGILNGDVFVNSVLAQSPTQITLKQGTPYTYTGNIYINYVIGGTGNFSVLTTSLSTNTNIFSYYVFSTKVDGTVTNGMFSFNLQPVTALTTVYRVMQVNFTLDNGMSGSYIYNLGYYALGGSDDNGLVPYPTPIGGDNGGLGGGGTGTTGLLSFLTNWQSLAIIIIYAVFCGLLTWKFAFVGLIAGLDIATTICFVTGLLGGLMYPVLGLTVVVNIALIIMGSGLLNRTKKDMDN